MPAISSELASSSRPSLDADGDIFEQDIWDDEDFESSSNNEINSEMGRMEHSRSEVSGTSQQIRPVILPNGKQWDFSVSDTSKFKNKSLLSDTNSPSSTLSFLDSTSNSRYVATPSKMIPHSALTPTFYHSGRRQSAPVSIPVWKFSETENRKPAVQNEDSEDNSEEEPEENEGQIVPPHELLAREYSKSVTFSIYEGVGRTLRGRDLDGFRSSVLKQTGFLD